MGPGNWVNPVCSRLGPGEGPSPGRTWGSPRGETWAGIPAENSVSHWRVPSREQEAWRGGCFTLRGGPQCDRACVGKGAGETRGLPHSSHPLPRLLLSWPLSLPPCPPPASRREHPPWSSPERALPGLHFWDNSTIWGLTPCQLPPTRPDSLWLGEAGPQPVPSQCPALAGLPRVPCPTTVPRPPPAPEPHSRGRQMFQGTFHRAGAACPHCSLPDGWGSPTGYF